MMNRLLTKATQALGTGHDEIKKKKKKVAQVGSRLAAATRPSTWK